MNEMRMSLAQRMDGRLYRRGNTVVVRNVQPAREYREVEASQFNTLALSASLPHDAVELQVTRIDREGRLLDAIRNAYYLKKA